MSEKTLMDLLGRMREIDLAMLLTHTGDDQALDHVPRFQHRDGTEEGELQGA